MGYKILTKIILGVGLILGTVSVGCGRSFYSRGAGPIDKTLRSTAFSATISSDPEFYGLNYSKVRGTKVHLEINGKRRLFLETRDLVTAIEIEDLNNDGIDDFTIFYDHIHNRNREKVVGEYQETYWSTGKGFFRYKER